MLRFKWETEFKKTEIGEIPREWKVRNLGSLCQITSSKRIYFKEYVSLGIPFYRSKEIISLSEGKKIHNPLFISIEKFNELRKKYGIPQAGDLLLTAIGTIGYVYRVRESDEFYFKDGNVLWIRNFSEKINSLFLKYALPILLKIQELSIGSSQKALTIRNLKELITFLPSPDEQSRIATVLSWFDDLIENKKKQNEILEKTAMAIFKSWFVDFEPFRDGEFVYNEELDREVPKGWKVKPIGEVVDILYGKGLPESKRKNGSFPVVGSSGIVGYHAQFLATPPSIVIGRKGNVGSVYLMLEPFYPIDTVFYTDKTILAITFYIYHYLKLTPLAEIGMTDTAVPGININNLKAVKVSLPPQPILQKFQFLVEPLFQKIILNQKQIMILRKIRDTLLPQLVFGKLRVVEL